MGVVSLKPPIFTEVWNLVLNAADAMPNGGTIKIETSGVRFDESNPHEYFEVTPGEYILLTVSDTGVGMDEVTKKHAFDPFFTSKPTGKGTGLGLSTVYGIVKQSDGYIWIESELNRGAVFKICFPKENAGNENPNTAVGRN